MEQYLKKECELGRVVGPLAAGSIPLHINRFGVIPKPHQPGKWRLIVDLSHPAGHSVNDGIEPEICSLSYASIDDAAAMHCRRVGQRRNARQTRPGERVSDRASPPR